MYHIKTKDTTPGGAGISIDTYSVSGGKEIPICTGTRITAGYTTDCLTPFFNIVYGKVVIYHYTITAKKTVTLNGVTYQADEIVAQWKYDTLVDYKIYGDYSLLSS